jgi:hypothetical protein
VTPAFLRRLAVLLGGLILLWAILALWQRTSRDSLGEFRLARIDTALVDTISVRRAAETVRLVRGARGWTVNGFTADTALVTAFLGALGDTAARGELVSESPASQASLGTDSAGARVLEIRAGARTLATYVVGNRDASYDGVYLRLPSASATYDVRSRLADHVDRSVNDWRDKRIVAVPPDSVATVEVQRGRASYRLTRQGTAWSLDRGAPADSAQVAELLGRFRELSATGFATPAQADSANFRSPDRRVRLAAAGGRVLTELTFDSTASGFWLRRDSLATVFLLDSFAANQLTPPDSSLRKKR